MPATLTLKNVPEALYEKLKASAAAHRRSLNREAIVCLESALAPGRMDAEERLARIRALRESLSGARFRAREVEAYKRAGRR